MLRQGSELVKDCGAVTYFDDGWVGNLMVSLLLLYFAIEIVTSFLCSLWEAVLLSITPSYAQIQMQQGNRIGHRLQRFRMILTAR